MTGALVIDKFDAHNATVTVVQAGAAHAVTWDSYVDAHPNGTFFHLYVWRDVLETSVGFRAHYLIAWRGPRIVGVLPMMHVTSVIFGNALVSLPFCVESGILADDEPAGLALLEAARNLAIEARVGYLELRHAHRLSRELYCKDSTYVSFKKLLAPTVDANMTAIPRKQRAMVRKGIAAGLISRDEENIDNFFHIYATSVRNLGTPVFPKRYFSRLAEFFRSKSRITVVYAGTTPVAAVLSFLYKDTVMPYYGGGVPAARDLKAYDFMYWEVMRTACEAGFKVFDYGRSKLGSGAYAFKKNWGFEPVPLHYEYYLVKSRNVPDRNPNNPKYDMAVNIWKRLPLPLANLLGPWVSPYLA